MSMAMRGSIIAAGAYAVGAALNKAGEEALSFERSMYEVEKATNTSGAAAQKYADDILRISRMTGKSKEDIAQLMAQAGFAGRPVEELSRFTEYAAKATSAWGTSAEETGQAMAVIGNIYGANQARIEEIGDAINTAADVSATRETDLLEFIKRVGASGKQAGLSAEQVLAFGAAMGESGTRMEVAATGFESLLNVMKLGKEFSKSAGAGLKALGVDSTKMRKQFATKPLEATLDLLNKINNVSDPLKRAEILTDIFGKEYQDDIQKLMNSLPRVNALLQTMGDRANYVGSVQKGFELWQDKDFAKIDRAEKSWDALMTRLGKPVKIGKGWTAELAIAALDQIEAKMDDIVRKYDEGGLKALLTPTAAETKTEGEWLKNQQAAAAPASQEIYGDDRLERAWDMPIAINQAQQHFRRMAEDKAYALDQEIERKRQNLQAELSLAQRSLAANRENFGTRSAVGAGLERKGQTRVSAAEAALAELEAAASELATVRDNLRAFESTMNRTLNPTIEAFRSQRDTVAPTLGAGASFGFGPAGTPPVVSTSLDEAKGKAAEAGAAIQALGTTVAPIVDISSIEMAHAKVRGLLDDIAQIGPAMQAAGGGITSTSFGQRFQSRRGGSFADFEHS